MARILHLALRLPLAFVGLCEKMRILHLALCLPAALALVAPRTPRLLARQLQTLAYASSDDAATAAVAVWRKGCGGSDATEEDLIPARFQTLSELVGEDAAVKIVRNSDGRAINMDSGRCTAYIEAWVARCGDRDAAIDLLCKNPNLLAGELTGQYGIENAPVGQAQAIAAVMDLTRKIFGG